MTDLTTLTAGERRRILDDYLDAVFGDQHSQAAEHMRLGAPELPDDPTADQSPRDREDRSIVAERIEAFSDRRVARHWMLVAIANGWPQNPEHDAGGFFDAWQWYARALRAHPLAA